MRPIKSLSLFLSIVFCLSLFSCASKQERPGFSHLPANVEVSVSPGDGRVGMYTSTWQGFRTSSYWIEGPEGLILIDSQFLLSAAEEMVNLAEKVTGKKAVLAIVLHPNPDKFNGTSIFQKRGIKVVTSEQVLKQIPAVHKLRTEWFYDRFKPDYPSEEPKPESFGSTTKEISAAGLTVKAHVLGEGASEAHVVVEFEKHVFVGDLVTQGFHSWLELGLLKPWLERISEIEAINPDFVHTGRGGTGDKDTLRREREYLQTVIEIVQAHRPRKGRKLSEKESTQIVDEIVAKYPAYEYRPFVENGIEAVWKNLSR
jgi:glyoxylase-like metal-dependent hydrolase (beta-lactamase superfamily II)